jgi:CubicO group peptidase (beta-lactamase class C family)
MLFVSCQSDDDSIVQQLDDELYFPPLDSGQWESVTPASLDWNTDLLDTLKLILEENGTRAFMVLKEGKIVMEYYFGEDLLGLSSFDASKKWYWASAGKTLTAFVVGKAQEDGFLSIHDMSSKYLNSGWTSLDSDREEQITILHQLTMTSGLDDGVSDSDDFSFSNLLYKAEAGSRWAYHNAPYTLLEEVVSSAVGESFEDYFDQALAQKIGMDGGWIWADNYHLYYSTARCMARFGLLVLNDGLWEDDQVMTDSDFFEDMTSTSQSLNKSYGYLWWLNGKESFILPSSQLQISASIAPDAPSDMIAAIGKNGQYLNVVPEQDLVVVRMGEAPDDGLVPLSFQNDIWTILNQVINNE